MTVLMVPALDAEPWPSLGPELIAWMQAKLIHGPGDLRGQQCRLDEEFQALLCRLYEIYPRGHELEGRRRFKRAGLSMAKGSVKSEFAAWVAAAELHPKAPVRFDHWDEDGQPIGRGVTDPYIPMLAYTEEQTEELAYGALRVILQEGPLAGDFDIGLERIVRRDGSGKAEAVAGSPNARDGARTTFQHFDETHRFDIEHLIRAHQVMLRNTTKRPLADPWSLETTTAYAPGGGSVAENTMDYARAVLDGTIKEESRLFFFHRQASDAHDLRTEEGRRAAVIEAAGPIKSKWKDVDAILGEWQDPKTDRAYWERVHTNRLVQQSRQAFDGERWRELALRPGAELPEGLDVVDGRVRPVAGEWITIGFDGSRYLDATGIVGTHIRSGFQWVIGVWERPPNARSDWEVPELEVRVAMADAFETWEVWRLYADPPYWETVVAEWSGEYGDERVIAWRTNRWSIMARAVLAFANGIAEGDLSHDGDEHFARHVGNCQRMILNLWDDQHRERLWVVQKERSDSPKKIDVCVAAILSWEARRDALADGQTGEASVYSTRGILVI